MKRLKSKLFYLYAFLIHILLSIIIIFVSWEFLEYKAYNFMIKNVTAKPTVSNDIVIISIDNNSVSRYRWPWKRELYSYIFEYLNTYSKPKVIGYDAILSVLDAENPESDAKFFAQLKKNPNLVVGFIPMRENVSVEETDTEFLNAFHKKFGVTIHDMRKNKIQGRYNSIITFPKPYFDSVENAGSVKSTTALYGYLQSADNIISVNGKMYPVLALRMYMLMNNIHELALTDSEIIVPKTGLHIPVMNSSIGSQTLITFKKMLKNSEYSHIKYSASDIIDSLALIKEGKKPIIDPHEFDGKIVFIGANAQAAAIGPVDALLTPMSEKHPGVDIQATILDNIMHSDFTKQSSIAFDLIMLTLLTVATLTLILRLSFFKSLISVIVLCVLYTIFSVICFKFNVAVNVITPLLLQLSTLIFGYSYRFILEGRNKEKIKQAMGKYISQDVMKNVVQNIDDIKLGGKKAVVTVLFADIRGFTSMSEKMSAEDVSKILNEYFTEIEPIISKYNGVINKFIGDAVMAVFGDPIEDLNHPVNAVRCANEMLKKVDQLQDKWLFEGKPKIEIGIGINTGEAFVGNIGSEKRLEYTVIGDTVNLASRIESYNKVYKTNLLISSSTYSYVSGIADVIKISEVTIRGKSKKMDIYEVLRLS